MAFEQKCLGRFADRELVLRAQQGNVEAFGLLYEKHRKPIFALCLRMLKNRTLAEDLMQEAFLTAFVKLGSFRGDSAFSTWLYQVAVNCVLMHLRKGRHDNSVLLFTELRQERDEGEKWEQKQLVTKDLRLHALADRVTLERAIEDLSPGYRLIFILHDIEGYEHNEIAEMLGCSMGNTKSQLHKARMRLRETLLRNSTTASASRGRLHKVRLHEQRSLQHRSVDRSLGARACNYESSAESKYLF
jgi:RNA polymerase sigma-70 factor, ECF subfamily